MLKHLLKTLLLLGALIGFTACSSDRDFSEEQTSLKLELKLPENIKVKEYKQLNIQLKELNTGLIISKELKGSNTLQVAVPSGTYNVSVEGTISYSDDTGTTDTKIAGVQAGMVVSGSQISKTIDLALKAGSGDLIIEEIFFTGTKTPEGEMYFGDQYFKITNNTDEVLYADGLLVIQSSFMTNEKYDYTPNIMATTFSAGAIIKIPGTGTTYPVQPGASIIIAEDAINHKEFNLLSIDLSKADFQIFKGEGDIDNPKVQRMINVGYKEDKENEDESLKMVINNRGYYAYALARMPKGMTDEELMIRNSYTYTYDRVFFGYVFPTEDSGIKIPNEWIADAVNLGVKESFQWVVTSPSIDMGWTSVTAFDGDQNRYGKAVRRKIVGKSMGGKNIFKDTNNSTVDFDHGVKPSLFN